MFVSLSLGQSQHCKVSHVREEVDSAALTVKEGTTDLSKVSEQNAV